MSCIITDKENNTAIGDWRLNRKHLFWKGNFLFWVIILLESVIINPETLDSFNSFLRVFPIIVSGFLITWVLRLFYRQFGIHKTKLYVLALVATIYSFSAALLWTYTYFIFSHFIHGTSLKVPIVIITHLFEINFFTIALWSGIYLGFRIWEEWNEREYQIEQQKTLLKTSQLEMLKYQLNPHFLFNSLSSLRGLITADPVKAKAMVTQISEFLRYSLLESTKNEVQLIKEIEIIKQYLSIEQIRYNEDLIVEYSIAPETYDCMIPIFLIHPLVENAIKHGIQTSTLPLRISIISMLQNETLTVIVNNTGKWLDKKNTISAINMGIGLRNIEKRLEHQFPGRYSFSINKSIDQVSVKIEIRLLLQ